MDLKLQRERQWEQGWFRKEKKKDIILAWTRGAQFLRGRHVLLQKQCRNGQDKDKGKGKENLLVMSDSMSVLKSVEDNKISVYKNTYVMETRKRIKENKDKNGGKIVIS